MRCYFEGRQDLFENLKIMDLEHTLEHEWVKRQVFEFNFGGFETAEALYDHISGKITEYEEIYGKSVYKNLKDRFKSLMEKAFTATGHHVAVIVDEYDAPLQHTLFKKEEHEKLILIYRSFFPALKDCEKYLKCLFLTGVTKFTSLSLFTTLNTVSILGYLPEYSKALGLTGQEILDNFQFQLEEMAEQQGTTVSQLLANMKAMYDGYHFSEDTTQEVYNPFSVINALSDKKIINYWAASGASKLLSDILKRDDLSGVDFDNCSLDEDELQLDDVSIDNSLLILYQAGYLTIKSHNKKLELYELCIPNKEVRNTLYTEKRGISGYDIVER